MKDYTAALTLLNDSRGYFAVPGTNNASGSKRARSDDKAKKDTPKQTTSKQTTSKSPQPTSAAKKEDKVLVEFTKDQLQAMHWSILVPTLKGDVARATVAHNLFHPKLHGNTHTSPKSDDETINNVDTSTYALCFHMLPSGVFEGLADFALRGKTSGSKSVVVARLIRAMKKYKSDKVKTVSTSPARKQKTVVVEEVDDEEDEEEVDEQEADEEEEVDEEVDIDEDDESEEDDFPRDD